MYSFPELIKKIREASNLTQEELANIIGVSTVLISMIETGQKEISKNFIVKLSDKLGVSPSSITPFLYIYQDAGSKSISPIEKKIISLGESMQNYLINKKAKKLKKACRKKIGIQK